MKKNQTNQETPVRNLQKKSNIFLDFFEIMYKIISTMYEYEWISVEVHSYQRLLYTLHKIHWKNEMSSATNIYKSYIGMVYGFFLNLLIPNFTQWSVS